MEEIRFPYRASSHLPLLEVLAGSGVWERHGLEVDSSSFISAEDAHRGVAHGSVEFVSGNHITPYGRRLAGDDWVYLGQTVRALNHKLVVRADSPVQGVADLKGRRVLSRGQHPGLNAWLFLCQSGLDPDRGDLSLERGPRGRALWEAVRDGEGDAALVTPPHDLFARRAGMRVIELPLFPMVWFTTISTSGRFVAERPDTVRRFLSALSEGIEFFQREEERSVEIMAAGLPPEEGGGDVEVCRHLHRELGGILEPSLYPPLASIANVYELAKRAHPESVAVNPLSLWDLHYARELEESRRQRV